MLFMNNIFISVGPVPSTWVPLASSQEDTTPQQIVSTTRLAWKRIFPIYKPADWTMAEPTSTMTTSKMFHFLWKQVKILNGVTGSTFSVVFMALIVN